ncbi:hypothetical protein D3C87_1543790 [compost metagenome]
MATRTLRRCWSARSARKIRAWWTWLRTWRFLTPKCSPASVARTSPRNRSGPLQSRRSPRCGMRLRSPLMFETPSWSSLSTGMQPSRACSKPWRTHRLRMSVRSRDELNFGIGCPNEMPTCRQQLSDGWNRLAPAAKQQRPKTRSSEPSLRAPSCELSLVGRLCQSTQAFRSSPRWRRSRSRCSSHGSNRCCGA